MGNINLFIAFSFISGILSAPFNFNNIEVQKETHSLRYNINRPDQVITLPKKLDEISGIAFLEENKLVGINDEKGNFYTINLKSSKIKNFEFGNDGDFEDIEVIDGTIWILKSDGDLFEIKQNWKKELKSKKFETKLSSINDTEGLCYDKKNQRLLIACKAHPFFKREKPTSKKAIYSFDLKTEKLIETPTFIIDLGNIENFSKNIFEKWGREFLSWISLGTQTANFSPSGIAIEPTTNNIYVISSTAKLLLVLKETGEILNVINLDPSIFIQPEGICFGPNGTLYISNEAKNQEATILKFRPLTKNESQRK